MSYIYIYKIIDTCLNIVCIIYYFKKTSSWVSNGYSEVLKKVCTEMKNKKNELKYK